MLKKTSNARPLTGSVINGYSDSTVNTYSCDYINKMDVYSTDEVKTNKVWIDGKSIYRKVIDFGALPNTTVKQVAHNASNVADIWVDFSNSFMKNSVDDYYGVSDYDWHTYVDETYVYMTSEYDRSDSNAYITIKYTKTTD